MADARSEIEQEVLVKGQEEKTIVRARNLAKLALVFEVTALVLTILGVIAAIIVITDGGRYVVGLGLLMLMGAAAVGATLWAAARGMRLFGEYVAIRIWRYPRQITAAAASPSGQGGQSQTHAGSFSVPNRG